VSIIYEALRKTQRNREFRKLPTRERFAARNLDSLDKGLIALIFFLVLIVVYLYLPHLFKHHAAQEALIKPAAVVAAATPVVAQAEPVAIVAPVVTSNLVLNGVLLSDTEKLALINNKTYHVGDNVEGMRLLAIDFDSVKLNNGGKLLTLRTAS
jgi:hypothetical protein